jgi:hypothetical protein
MCRLMLNAGCEAATANQTFTAMKNVTQTASDRCPIEPCFDTKVVLLPEFSLLGNAGPNSIGSCKYPSNDADAASRIEVADSSARSVWF